MEWQLVWRGEDQCVVPSGCSSCALVLFMGFPWHENDCFASQHTGKHTYERIRKDLTRLADRSPRPCSSLAAFLFIFGMGVFCNRVHCNLSCVYCLGVLRGNLRRCNQTPQNGFGLWGRTCGCNRRRAAQRPLASTGVVCRHLRGGSGFSEWTLMGGSSWLCLLSSDGKVADGVQDWRNCEGFV